MENKRLQNFTEGSILLPLVRFSLPVLAALFLQAMYGAVDLLIVGRFGLPADVSAVSTGSQIMMTMTNLIASFAMGATILLARQIGEGKAEEGGETIGTSILLFAVIGTILTLLFVPGASVVASIMRAPIEAFSLTVSYIRICGAGMLVIIAYNLIGSVFRGIGDSVTPLITVTIACICNIAGDLLFVGVLGKGAAGAAAATVMAQAASVVLSLLLIRRKPLPFSLQPSMVRFHKKKVKTITHLGLPIALQDFLVSISFLIILMIVNTLGVIASAGVGVAEKVCVFIMLVPIAFMQSLSAFVGQNAGAGKLDRGEKALRYSIMMSLVFGVIMFFIAFFHGEMLASIFSKDSEVAFAGGDYLKAYGIDCMLTPIFFCFLGFYNGIGKTRFVMLQGVIAAFLIRVPVSFFMSRQVPVSLFHIGLAVPCSSVLQIILCLLYMAYIKRTMMRK